MKNNYEAPDVIELGKVQDVVLGTKPDVMQVDSILGIGYQTFPNSDDIDEEEG
jgi:hypothetical protein